MLSAEAAMIVVNWSVVTLLSGMTSFAIVYGLAGLPDGMGRDGARAQGAGGQEAKATCAVTDYRASGDGYEILLGDRWIALGDEGMLDRIPHAAGHAIVCARARTPSVDL